MNTGQRSLFVAACLLPLLAQQALNALRPPALTAEQTEILGHMSIVQLDDGQGGTAKAVRFTGVNVQIVNGLGATNGHPPDSRALSPPLTAVNGLGNLIVGYNELHPTLGGDHTGSHNIVGGALANYDSFGGLVTGHHNSITDPMCVAIGGVGNTASGLLATTTGGFRNEAAAYMSSVCGGGNNSTACEYSTVELRSAEEN